MLKIFKKFIITKQEKMEQLEQEIAQLRQYVVMLNEDKKNLTTQLNGAAERMKTLNEMIGGLEDKLRYYELQEQAKNKYNDNERNY